MKTVTGVTISRLTLYFGLVKTTLNTSIVDSKIFVQLLNEILAFKGRDGTLMVAIGKALETFSEALVSIDLPIESLKHLVDELLKFSWDHFSYNIEVIFASLSLSSRSFVLDCSTLFSQCLFERLSHRHESP